MQDTVPAASGALPAAPADSTSGTLERLRARLDSSGDFAFHLRGRGTLGGAWRKVEPCSRATSLRCGTPRVPSLKPDLEVAGMARGTLFGRVSVDVDYDPARESANTVRLGYSGAPGELLQRVEVGRVALAAPASPFLAAGVPALATGALASGMLGPARFQALWGRQTSEVSRREFRRAAGGGVAEDASTALDDAGYAGGQFFFLFDPALLRGYPHLDVRLLAARDAPAALVPRAGVQLFRHVGGGGAPDGSLQMLRALPADPGHGGEEVSGMFRLLVPGTDYELHPSGSWVALRQPLGDDEALAVAYPATGGGWVGDEAAPVGGTRRVRLVRGPRNAHRPGAASWPLEMRHLYLVSGSDDVEPASVRVVISRGEPGGGDLARPHPVDGTPVPYARLFGVDQADPAEWVDAARLWRPAREGATALRGAYLVFPTLRPFAVPPPGRISAADALRALGDAANPRVYEAADARERESAARFRIGLAFRLGGRAAQAVFALGTVAVEEGSERVFLGSRQLHRGADYEILYDVGEVHLRDPGALARAGADSELRITFQERTPFRPAPTGVAGVGVTVPVGTRGEVTLLGVSQREATTLRRPVLGAEPESSLLGGLGGRISLGAPWLTRALDALPGVRDSAASSIRISGEAVASFPGGAGHGDGAYLDDFEDAGEIVVPLQRQGWRLGSTPGPGAPGDRSPAFLPADAVPLTWQHDVTDERGRVSAGVRTAEIDTLLRVTRGGRSSAVLHLTLDAGRGGGWRSVTTVLSPAGRDLRDHGFLEFYASGGARGNRVVIDLGTVSEDALALDAAGRSEGVDAEGARWGAGVLDREWDPAREAWSDARDRRGMWGADCSAEPGASYPLGDARANCTRGNGVPDTEDLNANGVLDTTEQTARFVVELGDADSPWLVRDTTATGTHFRLYRVPLDAGSGDVLRAARHLRIAVVGSGITRLSLARMRMVGSQWRRRSTTGTARGAAAGGDEAAAGRLELDHVSLLSDAGYRSPPGIADRVADAGAAPVEGVEFNEKSLRLRYSGVAPGDRAEAHLPLAGGPRSFLAFRELRLWAMARRGTGGEWLVVGVGNGADDRYLYRRRLAPTTEWGGEVVVELARWQRLRAEAEILLATRGAGERGPLVVWDADSSYAVVVTERGRAANLAAVRELSVAVWNGGAGPADGEVWVDDARLTGADRRAGSAAQLTLEVSGGELFRGAASYRRQGGGFRHFGATPTFQNDGALALDATLEAGRFAPARWGLRAPLHIRHHASGADPVLLGGSDLPARLLPASRHPGERGTEVRLEVRGELPAAGPLARALVAPLSLRVEYGRSEQTTPYTRGERGGLNAALGYDLRPRARTVAAPLVAGGVRWTPTSLTASQEWVDVTDAQERFAEGAAGSDAGTRSTGGDRRLVQRLGAAFQPLASLAGEVAVRSVRELGPARGADSVAAALAASERRRLGGVDVGREAERSLATQLAWTPRPASWLSAEIVAKGAFDLAQDAALYSVPEGDSAATRLRSFGGRREGSARLRIEPRALARALAGDSAGRAGWARALSAVAPVEIGWDESLDSRFDRSELRPGAGYLFGWAGAGAFRAVGGDSAGTAAAVSNRSFRTRLDLPGALQLGVAYDGQLTRRLGARQNAAETTRSWPDLSVRWAPAEVPRPLRGVLRNAVLGAGYQLRASSREAGSGAAGEERSSLLVPFRVALGWAGGFTTSYQAEWRRDRGSLAAAREESGATDHTATLAGPLPLPGWFSGRTLPPLGLTLSLREARRRECRLTDAEPECAAATELGLFRDRAARLQAETRLSGMAVGVEGDYLQRRSETGERSAVATFHLGLYARFELGGGRPLPAAGATPLPAP